jgi:hypothetical protein
MGIIEDALKNLDLAIAELKASLQSEQKIQPEAVTNQEQISDEELLRLSDIRF